MMEEHTHFHATVKRTPSTIPQGTKLLLLDGNETPQVAFLRGKSKKKKGRLKLKLSIRKK